MCSQTAICDSAWTFPFPIPDLAEKQSQIFQAEREKKMCIIKLSDHLEKQAKWAGLDIWKSANLGKRPS